MKRTIIKLGIITDFINYMGDDVIMDIHDKDVWRELLTTSDSRILEELYASARSVQQEHYGNKIFARGLIEFTNYCKNDCYYCGIRRSNRDACRYRLTEEQILSCCDSGYKIGFRTFVLQGGEDGYFTDDRLCGLVYSIKSKYPDCAITLSVGEKSRESYQKYFEAGADRYLLRHETANPEHYRLLHPQEMSCENRKRCLWDLKEIGYQVGAGIMVGSPGQTIDHMIEDLEFMKELNADMVGIGPFLPHHATPFANESAGTVDMTIRLLAITRLLLPEVLLPATTALGTLDPTGREKGVLAGANVVMPNLSPENVRENYLLYDNKLCTGSEAADGLRLLDEMMRKIGYEISLERGDRAGREVRVWH